MRAAAGQRELLVKFKVLKFLGKGSYGSVFQVQRLDDNQSYALKVRDFVICKQPSRPSYQQCCASLPWSSSACMQAQANNKSVFNQPVFIPLLPSHTLLTC